MSRLADEVVRQGTAIVVATLAMVGLVTGISLHFLQTRALDQLLVEVAAGRPHPGGGWAAEHAEVTVEVLTVAEDGSGLPPDLIERARRTERPQWYSTGDDRVALVVVERHRDPSQPVPDAPTEHERREEHRLVAARAPRPTLTRTVGRFLAVYLLVGAAASWTAAQALAAAATRALVPLERARQDAGRVLQLGQGQRLTEDGPEEVHALIAAINALLDRLDRAHLTQSRFTAEAAHELRTPLAALLGEIEVTLRRERSAETYRSTLESIQEDADRLARLVDGLLAMARLETGDGAASRRSVVVSHLVASALEAEGRGLAQAGCSVTVEAEEDPVVHVEPTLAAAALGNLLRNAARHAPGAPVTVRVGTDGGEVRIRVQDGGPGVRPEEREAVFDRFARGATARRADRGGLGLGLPIAREIARQHGGDCRLEEALGGGTAAVLSLPLASPSREAAHSHGIV